MTAQVAQAVFGAGYCWLTSGSGGYTAPLLLGALQDISIDESQDLKALYGQNQSPLEQGPGKRKTDIKASIGRFDPNLFNQLYFGGSVTTGSKLASNQEAWVITTSVTVANSATWSTDLGVYNASSGKFMTKVASAPASGQYSVAAGVYTFASADAGGAAKISYTYTSTGGYTMSSGNPQMGSMVLFRIDLFNTFRGVSYGTTFLACQSSKLSFPHKMDDFTLPSIDFSAQDDGTGNVSTRYLQGWT